MTWVRSLRLLGLALAAALIPACESSSNPLPPPAPPAVTGQTFKAAVLSGRQEVPPVVTPGTGNATVVIDIARTTVTVTVEVAGLVDITQAHLHVGRPGVDGPIIFPLASSSFSSPLTVTLTSAEFVAAPTSGISIFEQALVAIENGDTYVNVHTAANPDGELRGQVGPVSLSAILTGLQEVPPVATFATGTMALTFNNEQTSMNIVLEEANIVNVAAAHIHVAPTGVDGPIIFPIAETYYDVPLFQTLSASNFTPQAGAGINTFEQAIDAILSGDTYVNVHTAFNPDGEIRGQILP